MPEQYFYSGNAVSSGVRRVTRYKADGCSVVPSARSYGPRLPRTDRAEYVKYCRGLSEVQLEDLHAYTQWWIRLFLTRRLESPSDSQNRQADSGEC